MTVATGEARSLNLRQGMTLTEYLAYNDGMDTVYELVDGRLVQMSLGTGEHGGISEFLNDEFRAEIKRAGLPWTAKDMKIGIQSPIGGRWDTVRVPDVVVLPLAQWKELKKKESVILLNEPPPILVVEIVSPSTGTVDYRAKRSEYSVLNISEYWIVDPIAQNVTVHTLQDGAYNDRIFINQEVVVSAVFPDLKLTAIELLSVDN